MAEGETGSPAERLGLTGELYQEFCAQLERAGPPSAPPSTDYPDAMLAGLGVPPEDWAQLRDSAPDPDAQPELWWVLERLHQRLIAGMGDAGAPVGYWPPLPAELGLAGRLLFAHAYLSAVPAAQAHHRALGIDPAISAATLRDLGRRFRLAREFTGETGFDAPFWPELHVRGLLYELGRLQFNLMRIRAPGHWQWYDESAPEAQRTGWRSGDAALGVHIPETGPLDPAAVGASLAAARDFFARHFPDDTRRVGICTSWLLDPQLAEVLPETANIVRFQRRFTLIDGEWPGDHDVLSFVFKRRANWPMTDADFAGLPRRTRLQRALLDRLESGGHWHVRTGWLEL